MKRGILVERKIDDIRFLAKIENVDSKNETVTLQYIDDGNVEDSVPFNEVLMIADSKNCSSSSQKETKQHQSISLSKPLAGLVDDDYEVRNKLMPVIVLHGNREQNDNAIIMNSAENKLAAGGGLRALRYLKNS